MLEIDRRDYARVEDREPVGYVLTRRNTRRIYACPLWVYFSRLKETHHKSLTTHPRYHVFMEPTPTDPAPSRTGILILVTAAIIGALIAIAAFSSRADPSPTAQVAAADLAPDFTVDLLDGSTFNLVDHLDNDGRPVILNLWASWCAPCRAEMPDFDRFQAEQPGILVIGVAVSDREDLARALADELGVSYPLGFDATETVAAAYPPLGMPSTWFIGEDRTIRKQVTGQISLATLRELAAGSFGF